MNEIAKKLDKANVEDILSLTSTQAGMLFHYISENDSQLYYEQLCIRFSGRIDDICFRNAWGKVVQDNEILRSVFRWEGLENPVQIILKQKEIPIIIMHDRQLSNNEQIEFLKNDLKKGIDIARDPFRITLINSSTDSIMIVTSHHILFDGWSNSIILNEFLANYNQLQKGQALFQRNKPKFRSYIEWLSKQDKQAQTEYWSGYLKGFDERTNIAVHETQIGINNKNQDNVKTIGFLIEKDSDLFKDIQRVLQNGDWTISTLFYTVWGLLLQKYNNADDVVFGTTVSGRPEYMRHVNEIVGLFINTIPMRLDFQADKTIRKMLDEVSHNIIYRKDMETTPLIDVNKASGFSSGSLFDSIVVIDNYPKGENAENASLCVKSFSISEKTNYTAVLQVILFDDYQIDLHFYDSAIPYGMAERLVIHFKQLLSEITKSIDTKICDLQIITDDEKEMLLRTESAVDSDYDQEATIHKLFERTAEYYPAKPAVVFKNDCLTYEELNKKANILADIIKKEGVTPRSMVGLALPRSTEMIVAVLAILKANAICVPLDVDHPVYRNQFIMQDSNIQMLITSNTINMAFSGKNLFIEDIPISGEELITENQKDTINAQDVAYLIYTSGSTGNPKGAMLHHHGIINHCFAKIDVLDINADDKVCNNFSINVVASIWQILVPLFVGATLVIHSEAVEKNPLEQFAQTAKDEITIIEVIASVLSSYIDSIDHNPIPLPKLRKLALTSEEVKPYLVDKFYAHYANIPLVDCYGQTECCDDTLHYVIPYQEKTDIVPIGFQARNTRAYILDRHGNLQPTGVIGELCISGYGVIKGYWNRPELNAEKFVPNPYEDNTMYRTGDLAKRGENGLFYYAGRVDHQIKIRGNRVELAEIEDRFMRIPGIQTVSILTRGEDADKTLCAYYVATTSQTVNEIRSYLLMYLPDYAVPSHYIALEAMPLTPNGKIDKNKLREMESNTEIGTAYEAPSNQLEETILRIWEKYLKRDNIGIHDNFFDAGGHSLLLMSVMNALNQELKCQLNIVEMFQFNTIALIAKSIRSSGKDINLFDKNTLPENSAGSREENEGIAIIGMSGRFPGADNVRKFWGNIKNGYNGISFFDDPDTTESNIDNQVNAWGVLDNVDLFDADFFDITPREAEIMDPQQRLFMECAWEALENAGYSNEQYAKRTGVFAGTGISTYMLRNLQSNKHIVESMGNFQIAIGNDKDFVATRTAYKLGLMGPAVTIQTACSTSLTAVHQACRALEHNECDLALAGGVHITLPQDEGYVYEEGGNMSPDGLCRTFDDGARGSIMGNGAGVVVLKRYAQALNDRDTIIAVIKGTALNNDGKAKVGFTAPSVDGQVDVIRMAQKNAGTHPGDIGYVEAHGTATRLGDPIEIAALTQAFSMSTIKKGYCALGSLKSSIGHLDVAAGVAGLIKAALVVKTGLIPPLLHFALPNSEIALEETPFYINRELSHWDTNAKKRKAAVSSFGIGGTNVHMILEEAEELELLKEDNQSTYFLNLSAKTIPALKEYAAELCSFIKTNPDVSLGDICFTLQCGRKSFPYRTGKICNNREEAIDFLQEFQTTENRSAIFDTTEKVFRQGDSLEDTIANWLAGFDVNFEYHDTRYRRIPLPTYPFQRKRYWIAEKPQYGSERAETIKRMPMDQWFHIPTWQRSHTFQMLDHSSLFLAGSCLVFLDGAGIGQSITERFRTMGLTAVVVVKGSCFEKHSTVSYSINPAEENDYSMLINSLTADDIQIKSIIHLWNVDQATDAIPCDVIFDREQYNGFFSLLFLSKALTKYTYDQEVELWAISSNIQKVLLEDIVLAEKSTALGMCKVIRQENPNIFTHSVDLSYVDIKQQERLVDIVEKLLLEITQAADELAVAYRNGERWRQAMEQLRVKLPQTICPFDEHGVYILVGGLGRIGKTLAKKIVSDVNTTVIIIGRSLLPPEDEWDKYIKDCGEHISQIGALRELKGYKGDVDYYSADICDGKKIEAVIGEIHNKYKRIDGVIHLAGITGEEAVHSIEELNVSIVKKQFASKTIGLWNLVDACTPYKPKFLLTISSLCAIMGGLGSAAYASANVYMDAYAQGFKGAFPVKSINWEAWESNESTGKWLTLDQYAITDTEGESVFETVVNAAKIPQIVVSSGQLSNRIKQWTVRQKAEEKASNRPVAKHRRSEQTNSSSPPEPEGENLIMAIWEEMLGLELIGVEDNFFELGGHSLLATKIVARLREIFQTDLTLRHLFAAPTIRGLYTTLTQTLLSESIVNEIAELYQKANSLSVEEFQRLLENEK